MSSPIRIGISGKRRSGKSELALAFVPFGFSVVSFADPLKDLVAKEVGLSRVELERRKEDFRSALQSRGHEERRRDPNHWVNALKYRIDGLKSNIVVPDVRFPNEATMLRQQNFFLIRLECSYDVRKERAALAGSPFADTRTLEGGWHDSNESETALDAWEGWNAKIDTGLTRLCDYDTLARYFLIEMLKDTV